MLQPEPHIGRINPPFHGGTGFAGIPAGLNVLDFSTCCNPYPPPSLIRRSIAGCDFSRYPDPESRELTQALARSLRIQSDNIIAGSGSTEILRLAALAYLGPGDRALIPTPTYGEYELACLLTGADIDHYKMEEKHCFRLNTNNFIQHAQALSPKAVFLCNPNNPTGQYLTQHEIEVIICSLPAALIVLDEAYIAFTRGAWDSTQLLKYDNLLIVRSLTKDFALAGLRLGYGLAAGHIIKTLKKVRPPWNVSSAAQQAGLAALNCAEYLQESCRRIEKGRRYLMVAIESMGYSVIDTSTNFFLVKTGNASEFQKKLLIEGILVRDCTSFGLPDYIRIAPRKMSDCRKLVQIMKRTAEAKQ